MAAMQLALRAGAEVFGTAGSAEKRAFVRSLGARAVFSSRHAGFADELLALTGGRGVDIVLNALTGEFIPQSLSVLAPGGGWAVQPGQLDTARQNGFVVYLKTMVMTAAKRAASDNTRPILAGEDPVDQMRNLLKEREPFYSKADAEVKNDNKPPEVVADEVVAIAKEKAGW